MRAHIDTVSITGSLSAEHASLALGESTQREAAVQLLRFVFSHWSLDIAEAGRINGYLCGFRLSLDGVSLGHVAFGGNCNKAGAHTWQVNLTGTGCAVYTSAVNRWSNLADKVQRNGWRITRCDVALDDLDGNFTVDKAVAWYRDGQFAGQGRPPKCSQAGDWVNEVDKDGRTFYVGKRGNAKMLRVYEKGKQLGDADSRWVRWEIEFRNVDYIISPNVLRDPLRYAVGAYKCMQEIAAVAGERFRAMQKAANIQYQALLRHARRSYGKLVHVMVSLGEDVAAVLTEGVAQEPPRRLLRVSLEVGHPPVQ